MDETENHPILSEMIKSYVTDKYRLTKNLHDSKKQFFSMIDCYRSMLISFFFNMNVDSYTLSHVSYELNKKQNIPNMQHLWYVILRDTGNTFNKDNFSTCLKKHTGLNNFVIKTIEKPSGVFVFSTRRFLSHSIVRDNNKLYISIKCSYEYITNKTLTNLFFRCPVSYEIYENYSLIMEELFVDFVKLSIEPSITNIKTLEDINNLHDLLLIDASNLEKIKKEANNMDAKMSDIVSFVQDKLFKIIDKKKQRINNYQADVLQHIGPIDTIICSGYGLGGAVSSLVSCYLKRLDNNLNVINYTFGSPNIGNESFCRMFNRYVVSFDFMNSGDVHYKYVDNFHDGAWGNIKSHKFVVRIENFRDTKKEWLSKKNANVATLYSSDNHSIEQYLSGILTQEFDFFFYNYQSNFTPFREIKAKEFTEQNTDITDDNQLIDIDEHYLKQVSKKYILNPLNNANIDVNPNDLLVKRMSLFEKTKTPYGQQQLPLPRRRVNRALESILTKTPVVAKRTVRRSMNLSPEHDIVKTNENLDEEISQKTRKLSQQI